MNKYIEAIKAVDLDRVKEILNKDAKWLQWAEPTGKNALHYLCGLGPAGDRKKADAALNILKLLLGKGMDINSIHKIPEKNGYFPGTPLWYAYTRGRNERLYKYLLTQGANPDHCWWAIAWYDDIPAAKLWLKHGATIDRRPSPDELFLGSFQWKKFDFAYWLLEIGADVNAADTSGNTALMMAVKRKDEGEIRRLVSRGADADRTNDKGMSARSIAIANGPRRLLDLL